MEEPRDLGTDLSLKLPVRVVTVLSGQPVLEKQRILWTCCWETHGQIGQANWQKAELWVWSGSNWLRTHLVLTL